MNPLYTLPSYWAHVFNGLFLLFAFILLWKHRASLMRLKPMPFISLLCLLSISIGVHGITHSYLERNYAYNPLSLFFA